MSNIDTLVATARDQLESIDSDIGQLRAQRKTASTRIAELLAQRKIVARIVKAATPRSQDGNHGGTE